MATLKDIQMRLKAVRNIGKITNSMKMIAATRLNRAQRAMDAGRVFGAVASTLVKDASHGQTETPAEAVVVAVSSDRGLCGSIHTSVAKAVRREVGKGGAPSIAVLGDKARAQLSRTSRNSLSLAVSGIGKKVPTASEAAAVWAEIARIVPPGGRATLVHNRFVSAIAFDTAVDALPDASQIQRAAERFETDDDDHVIADYAQFLGVARLFSALVEGHAAELSSKRSSMESATKNAEEMVAGLSLTYNRTRQAVITNELVDIIVGASAL